MMGGLPYFPKTGAALPMLAQPEGGSKIWKYFSQTYAAMQVSHYFQFFLVFFFPFLNYAFGGLV
jgi:hypothetical protein